MDFIGNKFKRILLILGVIALCVWVVWPFLRGGHSSIQTAFMPMNTQMEALLIQEANEKKEPDEKKDGQRKAVAPKETVTPKESTSAGAIVSSTMPSTSSENKAEATNQAPTVMVPEKSKGLLDLNSATLEQLDKLPGIGESKARAILEYRSKKGSFKRVEELMDVKGIGEKMFEKLKGQVFVAPS